MAIHGLRPEFQPSNFAQTSLPAQKTPKVQDVIKQLADKNISSLIGLGQKIDTKS